MSDEAASYEGRSWLIPLSIGRRSPRGDTGQNLVEFAMVLPVLFLVVSGIFEFGNVLLTQLQIQNAVRDAARYTALGGCNSTDSQIQSEAQSAAAGLPITVAVTYYNPYPTSSTCSDCATVGLGVPEVMVTGTYTYTAITPVGAFFRWFGGTFGGSINLSSSSTLNNEC